MSEDVIKDFIAGDNTVEPECVALGGVKGGVDVLLPQESKRVARFLRLVLGTGVIRGVAKGVAILASTSYIY